MVRTQNSSELVPLCQTARCVASGQFDRSETRMHLFRISTFAPASPSKPKVQGAILTNDPPDKSWGVDTRLCHVRRLSPVQSARPACAMPMRDARARRNAQRNERQVGQIIMMAKNWQRPQSCVTAAAAATEVRHRPSGASSPSPRPRPVKGWRVPHPAKERRCSSFQSRLSLSSPL